MFNWTLALLLIAISVPGVVVVLPRMIRSLQPTIARSLKPGQAMPSPRLLVLLSSLQALVLVAIAAGVGTWLAANIGLTAPFFEAVADGAWGRARLSLGTQLVMALWVGVGGALLFLLAYYRLFRPRMDRHNVALSEEMRSELGLVGRMLYGGIYEEVLMRWGLMTLCVWLISLVAGVTPAAFWLGILVSGVLFGLGHLPGQFAAGVRKTRLFVVTVLVLNLWVSLLFGWLLWQVGLLSAMIAHMLFHLTWYPFERRHLAEGALQLPTAAPTATPGGK